MDFVVGNGQQLHFRPTINTSDEGYYLCQACKGNEFVKESTWWYLRLLGNHYYK